MTIGFLILLILSGLLIGAFARLALPGPDPMGLVATTLLGLAGCLLAGVFTRYVLDTAAPPGFLISLAFTALLLYGIRRSRGQGLTSSRFGGRPGGPPHR